jgi:pimeloyl-ACP methyl ester carboxylesterase
MLRGLPWCGAALLVATALMASCAPGLPTADGSGTHEASAFERRVVDSRSFSHVVFSRRGCAASPTEPFPVFLDGDGTSWIRDGRVPADPTPRVSVALDLLTADAGCGVVVSRPCTFGLAATDPRCEPAVWTVGRYAEDVIEDLALAIDLVAPADRSILLVGHSGGGLLATHIAARLDRVEGLITLGANLDVEAWSAHHGYTKALAASTPPLPFPLDSRVAQLHVFGGRDATAPIGLAAEALARDPRAGVLVLPSADHVCCWIDTWADVRDAFERARR